MTDVRSIRRTRAGTHPRRVISADFVRAAVPLDDLPGRGLSSVHPHSMRRTPPEPAPWSALEALGTSREEDVRALIGGTNWPASGVGSCRVVPVRTDVPCVRALP